MSELSHIKVTDLSDQNLKHVLWDWHIGMCQGFGGDVSSMDKNKYPPEEGYVKSTIVDVNDKAFNYYSLVQWAENNKALYLIDGVIHHRPEVKYGIVPISQAAKFSRQISPYVSVIDIETAGTLPCTEIKTISVVTGNVLTGEILHVLDVKVNSLNLNRSRTKGTIEWWAREKVKNPVAWHIANSSHGQLSMKEALEQLIDYFNFIRQTLGDNVAIFANGPEFDTTILENALRQLKLSIPWFFANLQSCRTGVWFERIIFGTDLSNMSDLFPRTHISLEDAKREFYILCSQVKAMKESFINLTEAAGEIASEINNVLGEKKAI